MKREINKSKKTDPIDRDDTSTEGISDRKIVTEPLTNMYFDFDISGNEADIGMAELVDDHEIIWDDYREESIFNSLRGDYVDPDDYNSE